MVFFIVYVIKVINPINYTEVISCINARGRQTFPILYCLGTSQRFTTLFTKYLFIMQNINQYCCLVIYQFKRKLHINRHLLHNFFILMAMYKLWMYSYLFNDIHSIVYLTNVFIGQYLS